MIEELVDMCRELDERRMLADDLEAFLDQNPTIDLAFGEFQQTRAADRAAAAKKAHGAANARRRAR